VIQQTSKISPKVQEGWLSLIRINCGIGEFCFDVLIRIDSIDIYVSGLVKRPSVQVLRTIPFASLRLLVSFERIVMIGGPVAGFSKQTSHGGSVNVTKMLLAAALA
jgi:hypothetical protein